MVEEIEKDNSRRFTFSSKQQYTVIVYRKGNERNIQQMSYCAKTKPIEINFDFQHLKKSTYSFYF